MKKIITTCLILCALTGMLNAQNDTNLSEVSFTTEDNISITATYKFPQKLNGKVPAIILIHQGGSSKEEWFALSLWDELVEAGFALLAYDVRMHGKSGKDEGSMNDLFNNPNRAPKDLLAAIHFLENDKRIDAKRIGILGASIGANLACMASASDAYTIKSVVVMSGKTSAVKNLGDFDQFIPFNAFFIASKGDQGGKRELWAQNLYNLTKGEKQIEIANGNAHGSYMLRGNAVLQNKVLDWFSKTL